MSSNVQVVLREDVHKLGRAGELVQVRRGHARNLLVPRGLAVLATKGNIRQLEHEQSVARARAATQRKDAEQLVERISQVQVEISKATGEGGKLYGSVTSKDVAEALAQQGVEVDRRKLQLPENIKELGEYEIVVRLAADVNGTFKLNVVPQT